MHYKMLQKSYSYFNKYHDQLENATKLIHKTQLKISTNRMPQYHEIQNSTCLPAVSKCVSLCRIHETVLQHKIKILS